MYAHLKPVSEQWTHGRSPNQKTWTSCLRYTPYFSWKTPTRSLFSVQVLTKITVIHFIMGFLLIHLHFKTKITEGSFCPTAVLSSDLLWPSEAQLPRQMKWRRWDCCRLHVKSETIITVTQAESSRHRRGLRRLKPASERASERCFR